MYRTSSTHAFFSTLPLSITTIWRPDCLYLQPVFNYYSLLMVSDWGRWIFLLATCMLAMCACVLMEMTFGKCRKFVADHSRLVIVFSRFPCVVEDRLSLSDVCWHTYPCRIVANCSYLGGMIPIFLPTNKHRGGSSFLLRGGVDQNNDDAEHRPRAAKRRADFFGGVYLNPVSVFLASINTMETIKSSAW